MPKKFSEEELFATVEPIITVGTIATNRVAFFISKTFSLSKRLSLRRYSHVFRAFHQKKDLHMFRKVYFQSSIRRRSFLVSSSVRSTLYSEGTSMETVNC